MVGSGCASRRAIELEGVPVKAATVDEPAPSSPRGVLALGAESLDVSVRQQSLGQLVRHSAEPGGGAWGPRALLDPSPYVQRRGIEALGDRLPEPQAAEQLVQLVRRVEAEPYTRGLAGRLLAAHGDTRVLPDLQEALAATTDDWERAPLALAAAMMGDTAALTQLQTALSRGDFPLEVDFFLACGVAGLEGLAGPLATGAQRLEEDLVLPAAASLLWLDPPAGAALFRDALGSDDPELRLQAVDFLADVDSDIAAELLLRAQAGGPEMVTRYATLALLARGEGSPREALEQAHSPDREDRQQATWALGRYLVAAESPRQEAAVRATLRAALGDVELMVVHEAIRSVGLSGVAEDLPALEELMQQEFAAVRVAAAAAMLDIQARAAGR